MNKKMVIASSVLLPSMALAQEGTAPPPEPPAQPSEVDSRVDLGPALREMSWVGFAPLVDGSRVFIRTNDKVEHRITELDDGTLVLELLNTRIANPLLRLPFYPKFFDNSAVLEVSAEELEGPSPTVRIAIKRSSRTAYTVDTSQPGILSVVFNPP